ncbi:MAG: acyl carrier protein [Butyrivibrio sp.]|nr:acyl carrier protein [Butyrivibrio sp.]
MEELRKVLESVNEYVDYEGEVKLLTDGIIDSVELVEMVAAIEEKFEIEILLDEITPENFDSLYNIWNMIERLRR